MRKLKQIFLILVLTLVSKINFATYSDTLTVNPVIFDSITVINFEIASNDTIRLDIFDIVVYTVKTYFNGTVMRNAHRTDLPLLLTPTDKSQ